MKHQQSGLYTAILAIIIVGLLAFGVPASTLTYPALILVCPLMIFMQDWRGGHYGRDRGLPTTAGRR